ncbi:hypothetical protein Pan181_18760 [Aeoliella mucimassa]|uniref:Uncharacterized protein n=1 Tax=Aeoliella mucimassa TaxID=2527972 RepID=A0A518ALU8_9BACT|nr:hypothetical protein Pan181_18760 [Aeoliella mucimassa]
MPFVSDAPNLHTQPVKPYHLFLFYTLASYGLSPETTVDFVTQV